MVFKLAEIAIEKYTNLKKVGIIKRPIRMDKAEKVNIFTNEYLEQIANDAKNPKIVITKYNFET